MSPEVAFQQISENFRLSDFLGNHSVYARGFPNVFVDPTGLKLRNARALCENMLEPVLAREGPMSISYGYISPEFSRKTVHYMNPDDPSHHRWDLGAGADITIHMYRNHPPIGTALHLDDMGYPYSRMITYSESPYICTAVSAQECECGKPRKALYENRFLGFKGGRPDFRKYASDAARAKRREEVKRDIVELEQTWKGHGYPTYHGGGKRQYQHIRVSDYTMVSDWLFDLQSISIGAANVPLLGVASVLDSFSAAGLAYDALARATGANRFNIAAGYVSPRNPSFLPERDWRSDVIDFHVFGIAKRGNCIEGINITDSYMYEGAAQVSVDVDVVLGEGWSGLAL